MGWAVARTGEMKNPYRTVSENAGVDVNVVIDFT
jgi:hypothetical protein